MRAVTIALGAVGLLWTGGAMAGPFCVVSAMGQNCSFMDANYCRQVASSTGGMCVANVQQTQQVPPTPPVVVPGQTYRPSQSPSLTSLVDGVMASGQQGAEAGRRQRQAREEHQARMELLKAQAEAERARGAATGGTVVYLCEAENGEVYRTADPAVGCVVAEVLR